MIRPPRKGELIRVYDGVEIKKAYVLNVSAAGTICIKCELVESEKSLTVDYYEFHRLNLVEEE